MYERAIRFPERRSFFLFGARGTGKSTLLRKRLNPETTWFVDLLAVTAEDSYSRDPELFCLSRDPNAQLCGAVKALPWQQGILEI
jgi:predicted AAA+ superfamily ATPase